MEDMFHSLPINVERDQHYMSVVDSCLADYRGVPKYAMLFNVPDLSKTSCVVYKYLSPAVARVFLLVYILMIR